VINITIEFIDEKPDLSANEYYEFTVQINGEDRHFVIRDQEISCNGNGHRRYSSPVQITKFTAMGIDKLTTKTKEEIAAEESVAKAKEALKAAENALKAVKEQK
jgi:hypothetical protein